MTIHQPMAPCAAPRPKNVARRVASERVTHPLAAKYARGRTKYPPSARPHCLCPHSIQYMNLKSSTVIHVFVFLYSGDSLYLANSASQSSAVSGGFSTNFQSVMDRPLRVSRVTPPRTTMLYTHAHPPASHHPSARSAAGPPFTSGCVATGGTDDAAVAAEENARRAAVASAADDGAAVDAFAVDAAYARHAACPAPAIGSTRRGIIVDRDAWRDPTSAMTFLAPEARAATLHARAFRSARDVAMSPAGVAPTPAAAPRCASAPSALLIGAAIE